MKMITPLMDKVLLARLDNHVKQGHAVSRNALIRKACEHWLDENLLPEEIDQLKQNKALMDTMVIKDNVIKS